MIESKEAFLGCSGNCFNSLASSDITEMVFEGVGDGRPNWRVWFYKQAAFILLFFENNEVCKNHCKYMSEHVAPLTLSHDFISSWGCHGD